MDVLSEPPYTTDPHLVVIGEALKAGRAYPSFRRWGLVEERLSMAFDRIWAELLSHPDKDLDTVLEELVILSDRLEITLKEFDD